MNFKVFRCLIRKEFLQFTRTSVGSIAVIIICGDIFSLFSLEDDFRNKTLNSDMIGTVVYISIMIVMIGSSSYLLNKSFIAERKGECIKSIFIEKVSAVQLWISKLVAIDIYVLLLALISAVLYLIGMRIYTGFWATYSLQTFLFDFILIPVAVLIIISVLSVLYMYGKELKYVEMCVTFAGMYGTMFFSYKLMKLHLHVLVALLSIVLYLMILGIESYIVNKIPKKKILMIE